MGTSKDLLVPNENGKVTSLNLVAEINMFRATIEGKSEIGHNDLLKVIRDEFEDEIGLGEISHTPYTHLQNGQVYPLFELTLSQAKQVLVRESKVVRKAVIKRLEELEELAKHGKVLTDIISSSFIPMQAVETFEGLHKIASIFGLKGNAALISANVATRKRTGVDFQKTLEIELKSEENEQLLNPTQLGVEIGGLSARKVNLMLLDANYQGKNDSGYFPLVKGEPYGVMIDSGKRHNDGAMIQQLKWKRSIIDVLNP